MANQCTVTYERTVTVARRRRKIFETKLQKKSRELQKYILYTHGVTCVIYRAALYIVHVIHDTDYHV